MALGLPETFSWEDFLGDSLSLFTDHLNIMRDLWQKIGIEGHDFRDRAMASLLHYKELHDMMHTEEMWLYNRIMAAVAQYKEKITQYSVELGLNVPEFPDCTPLLMERLLGQKLEELQSIRKSRLDSLKALRDQEALLCQCLHIESHTFETERPVPTKEDLDELEQHLSMLTEEKARRLVKFNVLRSNILELMQTLQKTAATASEKELCLLECDETDLDLSQNRLQEMKTLHKQLTCEKDKAEVELTHLRSSVRLLWDCLKESEDHKVTFLRHNNHCGKMGLDAFQVELQRCQDKRRANMGAYIQNTRQELVTWWDRCLAGESQRDAFKCYLECDDYTEELLTIHETEVLRWRQMYRDFGMLFEKLQKHQKLWQEMLNIEVAMNDPDRYTNRGGKLLQEERERKRLLVLLPKLEAELQQISEEYQRAVGEVFQVGGLPLVDFLAQQWEQHQQGKENERRNRQKQRKMEDDLSTLSKRLRVAPSPFKTPSTVGMSARYMSSMRTKSPMGVSRMTPGDRPKQLAVHSTLPKTILKSASKPPSGMKTSTPTKRVLGQQNESRTPITCQQANTSTASSVIMSYNSFMNSLNNPVREKVTRSTMVTNTSKRVLGSKVQPTFTNKGEKRRRSNGVKVTSCSSKTSNKNTAGVTPNKLKLVATQMPFRY